MTGTKWVDFFNSFGARDVYDNALPDIGKPNHIRPSKKEYIAKRLADINDTIHLQQALLRLATLSELYPEALNNYIITHFCVNPMSFRMSAKRRVCEITGHTPASPKADTGILRSDPRKSTLRIPVS